MQQPTPGHHLLPFSWITDMFWLQGKQESSDKIIAGSILPEQCAAHGLLPACLELLLEITDAESTEAHLTNPKPGAYSKITADLWISEGQ